jgi:uncharacterized protein YbjT (DUF2867 family)
VGIFHEAGERTFEAIHVRGPVALFKACAAARIPVIQFSALGADSNAASEFHRSKKRADDALLALDTPSVVLQPSLVFGLSGASARMFLALASLPLVPVPGRGEQRIQPVHVDDVAAAVVQVVQRDYFPRARIALVGPEATTLRGFLAGLRESLGFDRARFIPVPMALAATAARMRVGLLDPDALRMLQRGNVADATAMRQLLGRDPRPASRFIDGDSREGLRAMALLAWLAPVLRVAIAAVWLTAGVVSLGIYPVNDSLELLARTGITGPVAPVALYGAAALDLALGLGTLFLRRRRILWLTQIAVIAGYTAIITAFLPEQWLHPYGPVVKNLPMLAAIFLLYELEKR